MKMFTCRFEQYKSYKTFLRKDDLIALLCVCMFSLTDPLDICFCALGNVCFMPVCVGMADPLALVEEEAEVARVVPLQESLATLEKGCERSTGTSASFRSFKRTSTRNTPTLLTDHW